MATLELDDIQGIVARGYGPLRAATFLLLEAGPPEGLRSWLGRLAGQLTVASAGRRDTAVNLASSPTGLAKAGLPPETAAQFPLEFRDGMTSAHQRRILGDSGRDAPETWLWGGPGTPAVDLLLMLYAKDEARLAALETEHVDALKAAGLDVLQALRTTDFGDREPFGFRDGISQPPVAGLREGPDDARAVAAGEFVLGYANEYGLLTDRPLVPASSDRAGILPADTGGRGQRDLGRNGTYLVMRQLAQDVPGFWRTLDERTRGHRGEPDPARRTALAAKMVGRWPGGAPLALSPGADDPALAGANDFGYHAADADGLGCPVGAHVRRANPRDSLAPDPGSEESLAINRRHRILRRGRTYGPPITVEQALSGEDPGGGAERGLYFACVNANIARQFGFIQHTWANNPKFGGLYDDVDPINGPRGEGGATFTIPAEPVRHREVGLPAFVTVRGGGYFFLPGVRAVRYLASLGG